MTQIEILKQWVNESENTVLATLYDEEADLILHESLANVFAQL